MTGSTARNFKLQAQINSRSGQGNTKPALPTEGMYRCPVCTRLPPMTTENYIQHVSIEHQGVRAVCAICAAKPDGNPNFFSQDLGGHTETRHATYDGLSYEEAAIQAAIWKSQNN